MRYTPPAGAVRAWMSWELSVAVCGAGEAETPWCNKKPMTSILSHPYIHRLSDMESNDIDKKKQSIIQLFLTHPYIKSYYTIYIYISNIIKYMWKKQDIQTWLDAIQTSSKLWGHALPSRQPLAAALLGVEPKEFRAGEAQGYVQLVSWNLGISPRKKHTMWDPQPR